VMARTAAAKVDLTTLPTRDTVQLTIYNSADLTLAAAVRAITANSNKIKRFIEALLSISHPQRRVAASSAAWRWPSTSSADPIAKAFGLDAATRGPFGKLKPPTTVGRCDGGSAS